MQREVDSAQMIANPPHSIPRPTRVSTTAGGRHESAVGSVIRRVSCAVLATICYWEMMLYNTRRMARLVVVLAR